jgi:hypothetical protein
MSGKSQCKKLILDLCDTIAAERGEEAGAQFNCIKDVPAAVTCCDGLVLLNRIGAVMSKTTPIGKFTDSGYEIPVDDGMTYAEERALEAAGDAHIDPEFLMAAADSTDGKTPYGTWFHMYSAFAREVDGMFKRSGSIVVVLGFDKRTHVDGVKALTHEKRFDLRAKARAAQKKKDTEMGMVHTRGIPFTYDDICEDALIPYPFSEMLHGKGHCAAIVRYLCNMFITRYKPPGDHQTLLLDGHHVWIKDLPPNFSSDNLGGHDIPIRIRRDERTFAPELANCVGEFDHTAFFYVHSFATRESLIYEYRLETRPGMGLSMHIRTNDTDTLILGIVFLERFRELYPNPDGGNLHLVMEIPHKAPVKVDQAIAIHRVLELITKRYEHLKHPGAYFAYGLYMKENDYDEPFMSGVGHEKFMNALIHHSHNIGDLIHTAVPQQQVIDMSDFVMTDEEDEMITLDKDQDDFQSSSSSSSAAVASSVPSFARKLDERAVEAFIASCYHESIAYRTKAAQEKRKELLAQGKPKEADSIQYTYEYVTKACAKRTKSAVTMVQIEDKMKRHNYFIAMCEELIFDRPRSIPFTKAPENGYACYIRQKKMAK